MFLRRVMQGGSLAILAVVTGEATARVDDTLRAGTPFLASPSYTDLTIQDSLGTRGRPFARYQKWQLNGAGFRNSEIAKDPAPACVRIAVMGASETFGYAESSGKEYPAQLADSLRRRGCYEVLNTAVTGLPTTGQIQLWENWVSRFHPSIVVVYASPAFYLSEYAPDFPKITHHSSSIESRSFSSRLVERLKDRIDYPDFIQRRRVQRRIASLTADKPRDWYYSQVPGDRLALFRAHLDSLVTSVRASGATPVLVTHANRFGASLSEQDTDLLRSWRQFSPRATEDVLLAFERSAAAAVRELGKERGVPVVDVASVMTGHTQWFADFAHFNDHGAGVIAASIAKTVESLPAARGVVVSAPPAGTLTASLVSR